MRSVISTLGTPNTSKASRWSLSFLLKLSITIVVVGLIIWQLGGLGEVGSVMAGITPAFVFLVIFVITVDRALMTYN